MSFLTVCILPLAGCMKEGAFSAAESSVAAAEVEPPQSDEPTRVAVEPSGNSDVQESIGQVDQQSISNAPAKKVSAEIEVPANLKPSPATAEIIKLANAGVEESVMLSFVTNSLTTFNLRAEEIIYLKDIGIPSAVITAMIQRDHLLQGTPSNLAMTSAEAEPSVPAPAPPVFSPEPDYRAPASDFAPPEYASDNYATPAEPEPSAADYSDYYDALAPYGTWVDVEGVGRCWQPTVVVVDHGWQPYFNCGRWVYSDCGWYWMSDYSWGWAPFHYGRWFQNGRLGWCWCPGRVWGPSWVCWRQSGDYCGWAPLPPGARFVAGVGMTFHGRPVRHDFTFGLGLDHFRFIHTSRFMDRDLARNVLSRDHSARIYSHSIASTGIVDHNHRVSNPGIPREHVATAIHANILPVTLHNVTPTDGVGIRERFERNGRTLAVYRPDMGARNPSRPSTTLRPAQSSANTSAPNPGSANHVNLTRIQPNRPQSASAMPLPGRTETPVRTGQPLIVRGSDHSRETSISSVPNSTPQNPRHAVPLNSLVVIGQNRDSRVATAQPDHRPSWNPHNRTSHNRDFGGISSQQMAREDQSDFRQPQTPAQPNWWTQPQQPRTSDHQQFRHNRDTSLPQSGNWNATADSPRHNPTPAYHNPAPVQVPDYSHQAPIQSHQSHSIPFESRPTHTAPVESHQSHVPMESHQSHQVPVETHSAPAMSHSSPPAPAPAPASSSSPSHDSSSHSSGRGR